MRIDRAKRGWVRLCVVAALGALGTAGQAAASGGPGMTIGGPFVPVGISLGWMFPSDAQGLRADGQGFTLGAEVSYVDFEEVWYGGYADAQWTPMMDEVRFSVGPEVGYMMIAGVDAGLLVQVREGSARLGLTARALLTPMPFMMPYVRGGFFFDGEGGLLEAGVLCKMPLEL